MHEAGTFEAPCIISKEVIVYRQTDMTRAAPPMYAFRTVFSTTSKTIST